MPDPVEIWRSLSRAWKVGFAVFLIVLVLVGIEGLLWESPLYSLFLAALWGAAAGSLVRLTDRLRDSSR